MFDFFLYALIGYVGILAIFSLFRFILLGLVALDRCKLIKLPARKASGSLKNVPQPPCR